ncbi:hypothetical protein ABDB91_11565 [Desulfoscipio sp. XC116]|uniref:hypothetical protein n=1 Tax=Desulfoscipio sp. XC116 TaxID=3144975 RepID=UPI00325B7317
MRNSPLKPEQLLAVIESLASNDAYLLKLRFGFIESNPKSIEELAKIYNISTDEMYKELRQIEKIAQAKLREIKGS